MKILFIIILSIFGSFPFLETMDIQPKTNILNKEKNKQQQYNFEEVFSDKNGVKMTVVIYINFFLKKEDNKGSQSGKVKKYIVKRSKKVIKKIFKKRTYEEVYSTKREELESEIEKQLSIDFRKKNIELAFIELSDVRLPDYAVEELLKKQAEEKTGWELTNLMDLLQNGQSELLKYSNLYSLSAINPLRNRFVIIRKFAARVFEGNIDMLNSPYFEGGEHYQIPQYGMTLVSVTDSGASSRNVILPNGLQYESLELNGEVISIHHSGGVTTTNFKEINSLWTIENLKEEEILKRFNSLVNFIEEPKLIERHTAKSIDDNFFGELILNEELDWYEVTKDGIEFSFRNTKLDKLTKSFRTTEKLFSQLNIITDKMIVEMLVLKNKSWLEDGDNELTKESFLKEIKLHAITIYEDGSTELYYKANELFLGHEILTSVSNEQNYESSTIVG
jgi:hypothetical protein